MLMKKFFMVVGVYSCCVFVHGVIQRVIKGVLDKLDPKEEEMRCEVNACGFEVYSDSYLYSDEEDHQRLDRIGF